LQGGRAGQRNGQAYRGRSLPRQVARQAKAQQAGAGQHGRQGQLLQEDGQLLGAQHGHGCGQHHGADHIGAGAALYPVGQGKRKQNQQGKKGQPGAQRREQHHRPMAVVGGRAAVLQGSRRQDALVHRLAQQGVVFVAH